MPTREGLADALCTRVFQQQPPATRIDHRLQSEKEAVFIAHFLNGPGADLVMQDGQHRWISVSIEDLSWIETVGDFQELCARHIVTAGEPYDSGK